MTQLFCRWPQNFLFLNVCGLRALQTVHDKRLKKCRDFGHAISASSVTYFDLLAVQNIDVGLYYMEDRLAITMGEDAMGYQFVMI